MQCSMHSTVPCTSYMIYFVPLQQISTHVFVYDSLPQLWMWTDVNCVLLMALNQSYLLFLFYTVFITHLSAGFWLQAAWWCWWQHYRGAESCSRSCWLWRSSTDPCVGSQQNQTVRITLGHQSVGGRCQFSGIFTTLLKIIWHRTISGSQACVGECESIFPSHVHLWIQRESFQSSSRRRRHARDTAGGGEQRSSGKCSWIHLLWQTRIVSTQHPVSAILCLTTPGRQRSLE